MSRCIAFCALICLVAIFLVDSPRKNVDAKTNDSKKKRKRMVILIDQNEPAVHRVQVHRSAVVKKDSIREARIANGPIKHAKLNTPSEPSWKV